MKLIYPACFYKEDEGGYSVTIPDLLGCNTQGENLEEAIQMAEDAALRMVTYSFREPRKIARSNRYKKSKTR